MFASLCLRPLPRRFFPRRVSRRASLRQVYLRLEVLEDGTVPSLFNVGAGEVTTLIADIHAANQAGVSNTLTDPTAPERPVCAPDSLSSHWTADQPALRGVSP